VSFKGGAGTPGVDLLPLTFPSFFTPPSLDIAVHSYFLLPKPGSKQHCKHLYFWFVLQSVVFDDRDTLNEIDFR